MLTISPALIRALCEQGNAVLARKLLQTPESFGAAPLSEEEQHELGVLIQRRPRFAHAQVLLPVVGMGSHEHISCRVDVEEIPGSSGEVETGDVFEADAKASVTQAVRDAWDLVGGGPDGLPACRVTIPLLELLRRQVRGRSAYLATLLRALALFGDIEPPQVMATGSFDDPIAGLDAKARCFRESRDHLELDKLLVASSSPPKAIDKTVVRTVSSAKEAAHAVFGFVPWHSRAAQRQLHLYCGRRRESPYFGEGWETHQLARVVADNDLTQIAEHVRDLLMSAEGGERSRIDLSLAGPVHLAARLGYALKNVKAELRLIHEDQVWWTKGQRLLGDSAPVGAPCESARYVLATEDHQIAETEWKPLWFDRKLSPTRMVEQLAGHWPTLVQVEHLHLAVAGPWPLAWAACELRRNRGHLIFYRFEQENGRYKRAFDSADGDP